jgi:sacsin
MCYVASEKELKLFDFASGHLVPSNMGAKFKPVLESGKFNLTRLRLCHVRELLTLRPAALAPNSERDKWFNEFWEYWNRSIDASLPSSDLDNLAAEIFRATRDGIDSYVSPAAFQRLPSVVDPWIGEHQQLCSKIPGLYRLKTKFMPKLLLEDENSFYKENSFYRFIRALRRLASLAGVRVGTFVEANLDLTHIEVIKPCKI